MALSQGLIHTKGVYLGLSEVTFIEGVSFMRGSTVILNSLEPAPVQIEIIGNNQFL